MKIIDIGNDFYFRLANRNEFQGDGKHHAVEFRNRYLKELDNKEIWKKKEEYCKFDFTNVKKIGPSFANEAFAYFMKYTDPETFLEKVRIIHTSTIQHLIIEIELKAGYNK